MRRSKAAPPISPQQLKHFAAGAVAITCLLAVFASGEDWGAKAQVEAVEAKNRMVEAERKKLGTKTIATSIAVRQSAAGPGFGESAGPGSIGGDGAAGGSPATTPQSRGIPPEMAGRSPVYPSSNPTPGTTVTMKGVPADQVPGAKLKPNSKVQSGPIDAEQNRRIRENSRLRSGSAEGGD